MSGWEPVILLPVVHDHVVSGSLRVLYICASFRPRTDVLVASLGTMLLGILGSGATVKQSAKSEQFLPMTTDKSRRLTCMSHGTLVIINVRNGGIHGWSRNVWLGIKRGICVFELVTAREASVMPRITCLRANDI